MAFPEDRLSTEVIVGEWLPPDERTSDLLVDYEAGPIAVNDNSEGLFYQPWRLDYVPNDFVITPEVTGSPVTVLSGVSSVTQCTFAFDQNARVTLAYTAGGDGFLYWFDTVAQSFVTTNLGSVVTPTLMLDDKRATQLAANDVLLHYISGGDLYQRRQRDRFQTPILLKAGAGSSILRSGMNNGLRVQIELAG